MNNPVSIFSIVALPPMPIQAVPGPATLPAIVTSPAVPASAMAGYSVINPTFSEPRIAYYLQRHGFYKLAAMSLAKAANYNDDLHLFSEAIRSMRMHAMRQPQDIVEERDRLFMARLFLARAKSCYLEAENPRTNIIGKDSESIRSDLKMAAKLLLSVPGAAARLSKEMNERLGDVLLEYNDNIGAAEFFKQAAEIVSKNIDNVDRSLDNIFDPEMLNEEARLLFKAAVALRVARRTEEAEDIEAKGDRLLLLAEHGNDPTEVKIRHTISNIHFYINIIIELENLYEIDTLQNETFHAKIGLKELVGPFIRRWGREIGAKDLVALARSVDVMMMVDPDSNFGRLKTLLDGSFEGEVHWWSVSYYFQKWADEQSIIS